MQSLADGRLQERPTYPEGLGTGRTGGLVQRDALSELLSAASGMRSGSGCRSSTRWPVRSGSCSGSTRHRFSKVKR